MRIRNTLRNTLAQDIYDDIMTGSGARFLRFYTGAEPGSIMAPGEITDTMLGECELSDPIGVVEDGNIEFGPITENNGGAVATGEAGWCAFVDGDGDDVMYLTVSGPSGDGQVKLNTTSIVYGGPIRVLSCRIVMAGAPAQVL